MSQSLNTGTWAIGQNGLYLPSTSYVLDQLSFFPAVAYSLRLLTSTYSGVAINVRRSSDNTAMDIGFVNGVLDTATLLTFCGSGNGFVTTWYNQASLGSSGNATQSTAASQPQIVASGALNTNGGNSFVNFGGSALMVTSYVPSSAFTWTGVAANNRATLNSNEVDCLIETTNSGVNSGSGIDTYNSYKSGSTRQITADGTPPGLVLYKNGNTSPLTLAYQEKAIFTGTGTGQTSTGFWIGATLDNAVIGQNQAFEIVGFTSVISAANKAIYDLNAAAFYGISGVTQ